MSLVTYEVKNRIGYITMDRPEKRNALNQEMVQELMSAFRKAESDSSAKVLVLKANGESFCAGADLGYLQQLQKFSKDENLNDSRQLKELFYQVYTHKKVVIAQVQGSALAGGCGLVSVCDFVWSVPDAKFGYTEVKIGFVPAIVMVFLLRKIGEGKARQLLLTGNLFTAAEAMDLGIVHHIVEKSDLENAVAGFAEKLNTSPQSIELTKRMISKIQEMNLDDALDYAAKQNVEARTSEDCKKGIDAFLNKKPLTW